MNIDNRFVLFLCISYQFYFFFFLLDHYLINLTEKKMTEVTFFYYEAVQRTQNFFGKSYPKH